MPIKKLDQEQWVSSVLDQFDGNNRVEKLTQALVEGMDIVGFEHMYAYADLNLEQRRVLSKKLSWAYFQCQLNITSGELVHLIVHIAENDNTLLAQAGNLSQTLTRRTMSHMNWSSEFVDGFRKRLTDNLEIMEEYGAEIVVVFPEAELIMQEVIGNPIVTDESAEYWGELVGNVCEKEVSINVLISMWYKLAEQTGKDLSLEDFLLVLIGSPESCQEILEHYDAILRMAENDSESELPYFN